MAVMAAKMYNFMMIFVFQQLVQEPHSFSSCFFCERLRLWLRLLFFLSSGSGSKGRTFTPHKEVVYAAFCNLSM